jgi:hypothetical protein
VNVERLGSARAEESAAAARGRRLRAVRNRGLVAGGVAVVVAAVVVVVLRPWATSDPAVPPASANGCAVISLADTLSLARQGGASIIVATGSLTGRTVLDSESYYEMRLRSVQTLRGPAVATGWVGSGRGAAGPIPGADAGALWATDGRLFAIAWPARQSGTKVGPVLRIAPVVDGQVIFSSAGCWDTTGLATQPYRGPLAEIPGSDSYTHATPNGFHAVPLTTIEHLLTG